MVFYNWATPNLAIVILSGQIEITMMMDQQTIKSYIYNGNVNLEVLVVIKVTEKELQLPKHLTTTQMQDMIGELINTVVHYRYISEISKKIGSGVSEITTTRAVIKFLIVLGNCGMSSQPIEEIMMSFNTGATKYCIMK